MNKIIKGMALFSFFSLSFIVNAMNFQKFYKEWITCGYAGSNTFSSRNVKDFPSFWAEFQASGCGGPSFSSRNVKDFSSFYKEFKASGCGGSSSTFSESNALKN